METLYVLTYDDWWEATHYYYKDLEKAKKQLEVFLKEDNLQYIWDWALPIRVEDWEAWYKLSQEEFDDWYLYYSLNKNDKQWYE